MNESTYETNYDQDLAIALSLDTAINIDFNSDKKTHPIVSLIHNQIRDFQADMVELGQKFRSAGEKMSALIFMPANLLSSQDDGEDKLKYSAILIEQPDASQSFAPPSLPVSMIRNFEGENKMKEEAAVIKRELKQQLLWFQEFGRDGLIAPTELAQAGPVKERTKRHLTLITDHVQAA